MWAFASNVLQLVGAACLFVEWLIAFRAPPFLVLQGNILPDPATDAHNAKLERKWNRQRNGRGLLAGLGYLLLAVGLLIASWLSWPTK